MKRLMANEDDDDVLKTSQSSREFYFVVVDKIEKKWKIKYFSYNSFK